MYKKALLVFFFIITASIAKSQEPTKLVYYFDENNNPGFLIPFIETYLKDLTYSEKDLKPVYTEVISLNMLFEKRKIEGKVIDAFIFSDKRKTTLENSEDRNNRDNQIANSLLNYDKFLVIKIRPFNTLLEYQFLMYNVIKNNKNNIKDSPLLASYRSSSVFINPQLPNHKEELAFAIKQICPEVNEPPKVQINVNSQNATLTSDTFFLPVKDTINLTAIAIDPDSPKERFSYVWSISDPSLYGQIQYGKQKQKLVIDTPMVFTIGLTIGDGINESAKREVTLALIERPEISSETIGNAFFLFSTSESDLLSNEIDRIHDKAKVDESISYNYMFRKNLFGEPVFLDDDDSLTIYVSKGDLRIDSTNMSDPNFETFIHTTEVTQQMIDSIASDSSEGELEKSKPTWDKAGKYTTIEFYPRLVLKPVHYHYSFYANDRGVKSRNLKADIHFIKIKQLSVLNEYCFNWLGPKKGGIGLAFLGLSWQPFSFFQVAVEGAYPMYASPKVKNNPGDGVQRDGIHSRIIVELFKPSQEGGYTLGLLMHRFPITTATGEKRHDNVFGISLRSNIILLSLGSKISPVFSLNYFPNLTKRSYISGIGMFELTIGFRCNFLKKK